MELEDVLDKAVQEGDFVAGNHYSFCNVIRKYTGFENASLTPEYHNIILPEFERLMKKYNYGRSPGNAREFYDVTDEWKNAMMAGGHKKYQQQLKAKRMREEETDQLFFEQLDYSVQELKKKLRDYDEIEQRDKDSITLSRISIGIAILIPLVLFLL